MLPVSWAPTTSLGGWVKIVPDDIGKQKFFAEYETARSPVKDSLAVFLTQQLGALRISVNVINVSINYLKFSFSCAVLASQSDSTITETNSCIRELYIGNTSSLHHCTIAKVCKIK